MDLCEYVPIMCVLEMILNESCYQSSARIRMLEMDAMFPSSGEAQCREYKTLRKSSEFGIERGRLRYVNCII